MPPYSKNTEAQFDRFMWAMLICAAIIAVCYGIYIAYNCCNPQPEATNGKSVQSR